MKISVCMTTFNGEKFVEAQLISILKQLSPEDEVIISDDGSTDATIEIIESLQDERIKIFYSGRKNLIENFENALNQATGGYIFLSDQDDIWFDSKVDKIKEALKDNLLVFSNAQVFHDEILIENRLLFKRTNPKGFLRNIYKNNFIGATMAFKTELLQIALPFPKNIPMHDMWLGLLAELKGTTTYIDEPLIYYRRHKDTMSTTGSKSKNTLCQKIGIRMRTLYSLCNRLLFQN